MVEGVLYQGVRDIVQLVANVHLKFGYWQASVVFAPQLL